MNSWIEGVYHGRILCKTLKKYMIQNMYQKEIHHGFANYVLNI